MTKNVLIALLLIFSAGIQAENLPNVSSGSIKRIENFKSAFVQPRNVDIWLPDDYTPSKKYSVVYMHDGQMLFDSTQTWNRKEWQVDEVFGSLLKENKIRDCIVAGIWNTGADRIAEYMPTRMFELLPDSQAVTFSEKYCNGKGATGDAYLKFIVEELKPVIDARFSTLPDPENTLIMGSSMGALISLYAICEYPQVFGNAGCMSTAWLSFIDYRIPLAAFNYVSQNLPSPKNHRIYMDYGTGESDTGYTTTQNFIDIIFRKEGFADSNYRSCVFENAIHDEIAWSKRLNIPLQFLLKR